MEQDFEGFRLSPQQKRRWLVQQTHGLSPRVRASFLVEGEADPVRLEAALGELVAQYEILRTTYRCLPGTTIPLQVIGEPEIPTLERHDLSQRDETVQAAVVAALAEVAQQGPSAGEPGLRAALVTLGPQRHLLQVDLPALSADGRSLHALAAALGRAYAGGSEDEEAIQYADIAEIFNDVLESEETEAGRAYWQKQPIEPLPLEVLPFVGRRVEAPLALARQTQELSGEALAQIEATAAEAGSSLSSFLLACWVALLGRLSGAASVTLGVSYDGRTYDGLEEALGLFARTLPLRIESESGQRFRALLTQVTEQAQALAGWQDYFNWEATGAKADVLLPFAFEFDSPAPPVEAAGLRLTAQTRDAAHDAASLTLHCRYTGNVLAMEFRYDANRLAEREIARLAGQFVTLCGSAARTPDAPLAALDSLDTAERQRLLVDYNQTQRPYPKESTFQALFEAQVARTPAQPALTFRDQTLTYEALNRRANQLAHHLRAAGVGPESLVALCIERSPEMVVGLLGILKAGGAYLPLDASYPPERLSFMLEDSRAALVLTQDALRERLPTFEGSVIALDSDWATIAQRSDENPAPLAGPQSLAYVIYTSGSTGRPKGTMIAQQGLVNYVTWATEAYGVASGRGTPVHTPIGFDLTVTSLFLPLLAGQRVVLVPEGTGVEALQEVLRDEPDLSLVKITPAHLEALNQLVPAQQVAHSAKVLVIGGEALFGSSLAFWRTHAPEIRIINEYGPTETVVGCCVYDLPAGIPPAGAVPIGRPIANTALYVLDERGQPAPEGVAGELYIGGDGVARGYLNRPALSAERFVPDPFGSQPGARLYRTGDRVRYLPDGNLEYLGRLDQQVKVRGFRVELGEIEATIARHPAVREVAVLVRDAEGGGDAARWQQRLVAYLVAQPEQGEASDDLRAFLHAHLPEYMVPNALLWIEKMPLTPNGKVDRRALEALKLATPAAERYVAPSSPVETVLAQVWGELLGVEVVGVRSSFFELGGHSLLLIQLNSRIRKIFQLDLGLNALFEAPTVEEMARLIVMREAEPGRSEKIATMLQNIRSLSPEEKQRLLDQKRAEQAAVRDGQ